MKFSDSEIRPLVEGAREGKGDSLGSLLEKIGPVIHSYIAKRSGKALLAHTPAEDLVSEVMEKIRISLPSFKYGGVNQFKAWIFRICENHLKQTARYHKKQKRNAQGLVSINRKVKANNLSTQELGRIVPGDDSTPSKALMQDERAAFVRCVMANLKEDYQAIIQLRSLKELSYKEIASQMGKTEKAVRSMYARAWKEFSGELEKIKRHIDPDSTVFK